MFAFLLVAATAHAAPPVLRYREVQRHGVGDVTNLLSANFATVSPDGKNVYVTAGGSWAVGVFARDLATGTLTYLESEVHDVGGVSGIAGPNGAAVSPDGAHVYVSGGASYAVAVFARDPGTGALSYVEKQQHGIGGVIGMAGPTYVVVSPDGAHVYLTSNGIPPAVAVFSRNPTTGALTFVEAQQDGVSGVAGLTTPVQMVVSPDGAHLYVAAWGNNDGAVVSFARNASTGALTFLAAYSSPAVPGIQGPNGIAISPSGSHVYVSSWGNGALTALARDATTGTLTFQESAAGGGGHKIAMSRDGGRVYMASWVDHLRVFARDPMTGSIGLVQSLVDDVDGVDGLWGSISVAASPDGRSVYGQGINDNAVSVFDVTCHDGNLDAGEQCDDGNVTPGDGCDGVCQVEAGWECVGAPSWCTPIGAKIPVTGLKLIVVDKTALAAGAKAVFVARDPAITKGTGTDAAAIEAKLLVAFDGERGEFDMPAGADWLVNKMTVAKYVNRTAPSGGAAKVGVIKPGLLAKVVGKSLGDTPLDVSAAPSGSVYVAHGVVNAGDEHWHCTEFTACVHKTIGAGSGYKLICRGSSSGDPACTAAVPVATSSTTLPSTTTTTTSTTTTTLPPCTPGTFGSIGAALDEATGHCYYGFSGGHTWQDAQGLCEGIGGYLAVIDDADENALARSASSPADGSWIGFHDIDAEAGSDAFAFAKVTGGLLTFDGFRVGEPNQDGDEDCVHYFEFTSEWNDLECATNQQGYICEVEP